MSNSEKKTKLCLLRDISRIIREYEMELQERHDLCLNEGMVLCSLKTGKLSSSDMAEKLGLSTSNMSKVIRLVEGKGWIIRILGEEDKRQMYFTLSEEGKQKLQEMHAEEKMMGKTLEMIYNSEHIPIVGIL